MSVPLTISGLRKRYGDAPVIGGLDLEVEAGEIIAVVGPSGCGKSTLLRLVAGLDTRFKGEIRVGDRVVCGPERAVGLVFQEPRLFPWLTVAGNVGFAREDRAKPEARRTIDEVLDVVGLASFSGTLPKQLSGGMAQRAALARSLVTEPHVLLLDEPFNALDAFTRMRLQDYLLSAWERTRPTLLLVTHDLDEAVYLADRVVLLSDRPARVQDILRIAPRQPRDRRDPRLAAIRVALLEALHLEGARGR